MSDPTCFCFSDAFLALRERSADEQLTNADMRWVRLAVKQLEYYFTPSEEEYLATLIQVANNTQPEREFIGDDDDDE
jgi:hypothetical protein